MRNRNIQMFLMAIGLIILFPACKKEADNIFNMFEDVSVTYHGSHPFSVTDYKEINEGDSVYIDYTIVSQEKDMYAVALVEIKNGNNRATSTIVIPDGANKRNYSGVFKLKADRAGKASYRVYALNNRAIYMGDGYKSVTIDVIPGFTFITNRRIYAPDTTTRVAPSFYSISKAETYSFTNGKANSADIDFGIWRKAAGGTRTDYIYNLYSLSVPTPDNPLTIYDVSDWQKRATLFSAPQTGKTSLFNTTLVSGQIIETEAKKVAINLLATKTELTTGSVVFFLTQEGKYGAIHVNERTKELDGRPYISISVKMQK